MKYAPFMAAALMAFAVPALADDAPAKADAAKPASDLTKPTLSTTSGSVTVRGQSIAYKANAGTLILKNDNGEPTVSMFYVYYAKDGGGNRPVTFFFNGGPGSSTVWLHMGAFGPQRVRTADDSHTPGAPYVLANNDDSLLDVTDEIGRAHV